MALSCAVANKTLLRAGDILIQHVDDDEIRSTYWEACRLAGMVCLRKASDGDLISREEIKNSLMLLLRAKLERNAEIEPTLIFALEQLLEPPP